MNPTHAALENYLARQQGREVYRGFRRSEILARELQLSRFWIYIVLAGALPLWLKLARSPGEWVAGLAIVPLLLWLFVRERRLKRWVAIDSSSAPTAVPAPR